MIIIFYNYINKINTISVFYKHINLWSFYLNTFSLTNGELFFIIINYVIIHVNYSIFYIFHN